MTTEIYDKHDKTPFIVTGKVVLHDNFVEFAYLGSYYHIPLNCIRYIRSDDYTAVKYCPDHTHN